ncbi:MAG: nucleotidyl transferase AbiEii/AbiGii toxin family protein [Chloroflexi bacterium]|nr:nucleotidyl transferase AbiEii/AbiGii toxin family protein [Chloroflexota bacterium]
MAILTDAHWETVDPKMRALMRQIGMADFSPRFYLAGGTALALQLGHRFSIDLDFFSKDDEVHEAMHLEILSALRPLTPIAKERTTGNLLLEINGISVGFFGYGYPLIGESVSAEGIALASIQDIGLMKLDALATRGSCKDFYDAYFILQLVSLEDLLELGKQKYPFYRDFPLTTLKYMAQFDNADRDVQPDLLIPVEWDQVKRYFLDQARQIGKNWFDL